MHAREDDRFTSSFLLHQGCVLLTLQTTLSTSANFKAYLVTARYTMVYKQNNVFEHAFPANKALCRTLFALLVSFTDTAVLFVTSRNWCHVIQDAQPRHTCTTLFTLNKVSVTWWWGPPSLLSNSRVMFAPLSYDSPLNVTCAHACRHVLQWRIHTLQYTLLCRA